MRKLRASETNRNTSNVARTRTHNVFSSLSSPSTFNSSDRMSASVASPSLLSGLLELIVSSTRTLQTELSAAHLPEPWLDSPALHPWDERTPSKQYWDGRRTLLSALGMMTALVQNPREKILIDTMGYHHPAALNFIVSTGIPDILAAPDVNEEIGLHVDEIALRAGTHSSKTTAVLRFLCIHHVFTETAPYVFANNRLSRVLKAADPTAGVPLFWGEIAFRSATMLSRSLRDPSTASSFEVTDAPFARAFKNGFEDADLAEGAVEQQTSSVSLTTPAEDTPPTAFTFLASERHAPYCASFASGMQALDLMHGSDGMRDFAWDKWDNEGAVFVDVGASTGHLERTLLPVLKHATFICQDRPEVCEHGEAFFAENYPEERRVVFQPNNFFEGQPVKCAPLYILSNILHDWPEKEGLLILQHIASAMAPSSRLLVIEAVIRPTIAQASSTPQKCGGGKHDDVAPWPLLTDYGSVNGYAHHQSMEMMNLFNSLDRSLPEYVAMFSKAGLELVQVHRVRKVVSVMEVQKKNGGH